MTDSPRRVTDMHGPQQMQPFPARVRAWLTTDKAGRWMLVLVLLVAGYLRLSHVNWDEGWHIHPDERFLTMVLSAMDLPENARQFFDSTQSPMNPYNRGFGFFVYGTLPLFVVRVVAEAAQSVNEATGLWQVAPGVFRYMVGYDGIHLVGRTTSGIFDLACVLLVFVVGRRLYSRKVGLTASLLYAFAVLPLQQSHFFTVDTFGTFFALVTLYFAIRVAQGGDPGRSGGGWGSYVALGAGLGASLACRINLAPLAGIAVLAAGMRVWSDWGRLRSGSRGGNGMVLSTLLQATLFRLLLMLLVAVAVFRVAQPYTFGGTSLTDFSFAPEFRSSMRDISRIIRGDADQPPIHQWANRMPFGFPWVNMVVWGMGLPLGVAAWAAWLLATWQSVRGLTGRPDPGAVKAHLLPVAWIGGMFVYHSIQFSYTMRYYLPIYPMLIVLAAWFLWWLVDLAAQQGRRGSTAQISWREGAAGLGARTRAIFSQWMESVRPMLPRLAYALLAGVAVFTVLWGWGFLAIYRRPLTRIAASEWMYQNIPDGSVVANEHWDDALPGGFGGQLGFKPAGRYYGLTQYDRPVYDAMTQQQSMDPLTGQPMFYREGQIENYAEDTPEKRERLYQWLDEADVIVMSSNRLWGSIPRLPMRYPMTTLYYQLMAEEKLGFELAARFTSFPTILGVPIDDTGAEEAFSVYDHPEVRIYRKTAAYSENLARSYFDSIDLEQVIMMWPKQVSQAPTALYMTGDEAARQQAGGTWSEIFDEQAFPNRSDALSALTWLALLLLLGIITFPITFVMLRGLADRGYGVSKTLGVLALAWLSWIAPSLKLAPYQRWWIALSLGLLIGISAAIFWRRRRAIVAFVWQRRGLLMTEEAVFLILFGLLLLIRVGNPDLWHPARGGEKPMDFAYLNAVIRSTYFPPYDPWHAGGFMNYYYFGFVIIGTLIKLTGILPWVAYNLAVPTLFALTGTAAFSVAFSLADGDRSTEFPGEEEAYQGMRLGSLLAGLAGILFVTIIGNLGNVKLLIDQLAQRSPGGVGEGPVAKLLAASGGLVAVIGGRATLAFPNDWWFWNASRVIPDTINEFPFFTFTYGDLHAHMIALPLTLLALSAAVALVRLTSRLPDDNSEPSPWCIPLQELLPLLLAGFAVGALRATNTWDFPTFSIVMLAAIVVLEGARRGRMAGAVTRAALPDGLAFWFRAVVAVTWRAMVVVAFATLCFYPYTSRYATAYAGLQSWQGSTTALADYLTVWGFFIVLAAIFLATELAAQIKGRQMPEWLREGLPLLVALTLVVVGVGWVLKARIWLVAVPLFALALVLALGRAVPPARRLGLLLLALALAVTLGVEVLRLKDDIGRMNTVFKFYMQAWSLFGVSTALGLALWIARAAQWRPAWRRLAVGMALILFLGAFLYPPLAARAKVRDRFSEEASPRGLDGMAYMDQAVYMENGTDVQLADDRAAMLWLMRNLQGSPVILEAQIPEYRWGSRFSIYTGLPAVQGWNWHQRQQRSVVPAVVERRVRHVEEMYNTLDLTRAQHLLEVYKVDYVIVGGLERAYYQTDGLAKFDALAGLGYLVQVYRAGSVTIYEVVGGKEQVWSDVTSGGGPHATPVSTADESPLAPPGLFDSPQP